MRQFLRALNPLAALRRQVSRWMQARLPLSDTLLLTQRNVYILPTGAGWMLALTLLVLLLASIKRFLAIPQAYLGIAFGFGIPMAYAAQQGGVPAEAWWLRLANVFWAVAYDTEYAMVDRNDDLKIGIKTSAITFGRFDVLAVMLCYAATLAILAGVGMHLQLGFAYYAGLVVSAGIMGLHYTWIRGRERMACFKAFLHNNYVGMALFAGIVLDSLFR